MCPGRDRDWGGEGLEPQAHLLSPPEEGHPSSPAEAGPQSGHSHAESQGLVGVESSAFTHTSACEHTV